MKKVLYDELFYATDLLYYHENDMFSGIAIETYEDGSLATEIPITDGKEDGIARDFYESGSVKSQTIYVSGIKHGVESDWYESGKIKEENIIHKGYLMSFKKWSETGVLIEKYDRPKEDPIFSIVVKTGWEY
jgi:antitoxin component YwqK of YwqJK toxin-antitoxin module